MNPCIKTGCDVLIESHQAILHGDLYVCGEMFILRYIASAEFNYMQERIDNAHASFFNNASDHADHETPWLPPENLQMEGACVWIIHKDYVKLSERMSYQIATLDEYKHYFNEDPEE